MSFFLSQQEDPFKSKSSIFNSQPQEHQADPFHSEDPFKTDPFKGYSPLFPFTFVMFCLFSTKMWTKSRGVKPVGDARSPKKVVSSRWPEQQHSLFWESWTGTTFVQTLSSESFCNTSAWTSAQHQQNPTYLLFCINLVQSKFLGHRWKDRSSWTKCSKWAWRTPENDVI